MRNYFAWKKIKKIPTKIAAQIEVSRWNQQTKVLVNTTMDTSSHSGYIQYQVHKSLSRHDSGGGGSNHSPPPHSCPRGSPYHHRFHNKSSEVSPIMVYSHIHKGLVLRRITDYVILKSLEKSLKLEFYEETGDLDEHMEHVDIVLYYHPARGIIKCQLFVFTLKDGTMTWFKRLVDDSIDSWRTLCEKFTSDSTSRKRQPIMMPFISVVV